VKLPRSVSGRRLVVRLRRAYAYEEARQTGSHIHLVSNVMGYEHHLSVPNHDHLKPGTLNKVVGLVSEYTGKPRNQVMEDLFG
jgi:predicted RNA binding protein YcfA (HicA-like mRNA interferase family)